jgi:PPE-repeat protein
MLWHAMPPELNTAMLMAGAGPAPMLQAAAGFEALATALEAQATEVATLLVSLKGVWTGASSERAITAATPMVTWLQTAAELAQKRGLQAAAQAAAHAAALGTTPSLGEIGENRVTTSVLMSTNFLGINTMPICFRETQYFVGMWTRAGTAMDVYQATTIANTTFEPLPPAKPIVQPGMGEAVEAGAMSTLSANAVKAAAPPGMPADLVDGDPAPVPNGLTPDELMQYLAGVGQLGGPMQQLMQPLQQIMSMAGQTGNMGSPGGVGEGLIGGKLAEGGGKALGQMGLLGASPLSSHPLAGGSGPSMGLGLMHSETLPGAGGSASRTSLMTQLIDKPVAPAGAGAGSSAMGGAAPMGPMGAGAQSSVGAKPGLAAPALVGADQDKDAHDAHEDHDDRDDW